MAAAACASVLCPFAAVAQQAHTHDSTAARTPAFVFGAMGNVVLTRVAPAYNKQTFTELQLVQPALLASLSSHRFVLQGVLNAEGYTLKRGELNPGIAGEGYVDRRHPHTLIHELMLAWVSPNVRVKGALLSASLAAGRGFVPFGSDDPMMRPLEKYPVNHHHAQILERIQGIGALRVERNQQALALEATTFNGDDPAGPFHGPRWSRVGDSWSVRATGQLLTGVELSASEASVISPELQQGGAFDHRQHHAGLRIDRTDSHGNARYLLAEWARIDEIANGRTAFKYSSRLIEGEYGWRGASGVLRFEQTDRGEQSRLLDQFRSPLGHVDFQILGVTQWRVVSVALKAPPIHFSKHVMSSGVAPFLEIARAVPTSRTRPTAFEPADFYGAPTLWSLSLGLRIHAGAMRSRMGRYGVLAQSDGISGMKHGM